jgi:23S rRNA (cytidine1920-2'-O)/16S rRNA (cytidine1409-2'-O)-methyltransferase
MKERADKLVVAQGLATTRQKAQALIMAGQIYAAEVRIDKAGHLLPVDVVLTLRGRSCPYVSRGGLKLEGALDQLGLSVTGWICADVGASTGGFTDCLLQRGAAKVYALDVGHGQLDFSLRLDSRVVVLEGVNARYLPAGFFPDLIQLVVADASFISLKLLLPAINASAPEARVLALVKPQFEAGRNKVGKGGVVRDQEVRDLAVRSVCQYAVELGYTHKATIESPVKGPKGNVEYFIDLRPEHTDRP